MEKQRAGRGHAAAGVRTLDAAEGMEPEAVPRGHLVPESAFIRAHSPAVPQGVRPKDGLGLLPPRLLAAPQPGGDAGAPLGRAAGTAWPQEEQEHQAVCLQATGVGQSPQAS